jgi:hypothetical protein
VESRGAFRPRIPKHLEKRILKLAIASKEPPVRTVVALLEIGLRTQELMAEEA